MANSMKLYNIVNEPDSTRRRMLASEIYVKINKNTDKYKEGKERYYFSFVFTPEIPPEEEEQHRDKSNEAYVRLAVLDCFNELKNISTERDCIRELDRGHISTNYINTRFKKAVFHIYQECEYDKRLSMYNEYVNKPVKREFTKSQLVSIIIDRTNSEKIGYKFVRNYTYNYLIDYYRELLYVPSNGNFMSVLAEDYKQNVITTI